MNFWIVDVFSDSVFKGNKAAVCVPKKEISLKLMRKIATELMCNEVVFVKEQSNGHFFLEIFSPFSRSSEFGHGILAAAQVLFKEANVVDKNSKDIYFETSLGIFKVTNGINNELKIFLQKRYTESVATPDGLINALGHPPISICKCDGIYVIEVFGVKQLLEIEPNFAKAAKLDCHGIVVTSEGEDGVDFTSRFFAPANGINEDDGSLWNLEFLSTYWGERLNKNVFSAAQSSSRPSKFEIEMIETSVVVSAKSIVSSAGEFKNLSNFLIQSEEEL